MSKYPLESMVAEQHALQFHFKGNERSTTGQHSKLIIKCTTVYSYSLNGHLNNGVCTEVHATLNNKDLGFLIV